MKRFELLEHTGDVKIRAYGETKEALFSHALLGMNAILRATLAKGQQEERRIAVEAPDINALLANFLNEANYLRQVHGEMYEEVRFSTFSGTALEGTLVGRKAESFGEDIKAATFHHLSIRKEEGLWQTDIIFDV